LRSLHVAQFAITSGCYILKIIKIPKISNPQVHVYTGPQ